MARAKGEERPSAELSSSGIEAMPRDSAIITSRVSPNPLSLPDTTGFLTIHGVSAPARFALSIFAGDQSDANPLTDPPSRYPRCPALRRAQLLHVQERAAESDPDRRRL